LEVDSLNSHRNRGAAALISALLASSASAGDGGGLVGWVENTHGAPVAGALISVFGKGIGNSGLVTLTDSSGQFILPRLPAGSYTLRALGNGHVPSPAQRFTVLPDRDATFTLNLTPVGEAAPDKGVSEKDARPEADAGEDSAALREWRWLVRHKRRSVLEARLDDPPIDEGSVRLTEAIPFRPITAWLSDVGGSVEFVASPLGTLSTDPVAGQGAVRLQGRLADGVRWNLGGLMTDNQGRSWRMAAEFTLEPGGGHTIETGAGYGTGFVRSFGGDSEAPDPGGVGAMFVRTHLRLAERVRASVGARYSYYGFLADSNHVDTQASVEVDSTPGTVVRASATTRSLAPGGDLLTLSTRDASPVIAYATIGDGLRASKTGHYELAVDRTVGPTSLGFRAFYEGTTDQLVNIFEPSPRSLRMFNAGPVATRAVGMTFSRHFGDAFSGSLTYTYGQSRRGQVPDGDWISGLRPAAASFRQADFHDLEAHIQTFIDFTDTRLEAYWRINALNSESEGLGGSPGSPMATNTRFDIQLTQGLPFLQPLTRADWEVLVSFRNLFYERSEGAMFDEMVVMHPPKRVMGGIAVRF
jgi:hypothetical protein